MAAIAQTIAIVDKSGKIISTSKQLKNVFNEAKLAYMERKAEIVSSRRKREEHELRKAMRAMTMDESRSEVSKSRRKAHGHDRRLENDHGSGRSERNGHARALEPETSHSREHHETRSTRRRSNEEIHSHRKSGSDVEAPRGSKELLRRKTDLDLMQSRPTRPTITRAQTDAHVDMDLAYGEFHPDSLRIAPQIHPKSQNQEMSTLVAKCKMLLDEANCAQHSVKAIIAHLQKNPDSMAAVALTLAEISNLASKMAPGALAALKSGAPTVFAMLAAPEFLIAVGVGVGLTVVMFGGYKIIKKIKANSAAGKEPSMDEMLNVEELSRIEQWRRGIADDEVASVATSVEGEFITPLAAASMGHLPSTKHRGVDEDIPKKHHKRDDKSVRSDAGSNRSGKSSTRKRSTRSTTGGHDKAVIKVKKPSPLRKIFSSRASNN